MCCWFRTMVSSPHPAENDFTKIRKPDSLPRRRLEHASAILRPFPAERMVAYPVGRWVNDPRHDDPRCVEPAT